MTFARFKRRMRRFWWAHVFAGAFMLGYTLGSWRHTLFDLVCTCAYMTLIGINGWSLLRDSRAITHEPEAELALHLDAAIDAVRRIPKGPYQ